MPRAGTGTGLLKDYRWVRDHPTGGEPSEFQKVLQKLLAEDPTAFLDRYQKAEQAHKAGKPVGKVSGKEEKDADPLPEPAKPDEGARRVTELIDGILERLEAG